MRAEFVAAGLAFVLVGTLGLAAVDPFSGNVLSRYLPDGAMVVLLAAGAVLLLASVMPQRLLQSEDGSDFSDRKRCHGCGKMVPPETIRCPNCNAKFTSLYDNL